MSVIRRVPGAVGVRAARTFVSASTQGLTASTGFGLGANDACFIVAYARRDTASANQTLAMLGVSGSGDQCRQIITIAADTVSANTRTTTGQSATSAASSFAIANGWVSLIAEFASASSRRIITNGTAVSSTTTRTVTTAPTVFHVGTAPTGSCTGALAHVAIFAGTASDALIAAHVRGVHPTQLPGQLLEAWDLDRVGPIIGLVRGTVLTPVNGGSLTPGPPIQGPPRLRRFFVVDVFGATNDTSLQAALAARGMVTGALSTGLPLTAGLTVGASLAASLTTSITPAAALSLRGTTAAGLTTAIAPAAALSGRGTTAAGLTTAVVLAAGLTVRGTAGASLTTSVALASSLTLRGTLLGDLATPSIAWAAALTGRVTVAGALTTAIRPAAALTGRGALSGELLTALALAANPSGRGTLASALTTQPALVAALVGRAFVAATTLQTAVRLAAALQGRGVLGADLTVTPIVVPDAIVIGGPITRRRVTAGTIVARRVAAGPITRRRITAGPVTSRRHDGTPVHVTTRPRLSLPSTATVIEGATIEIPVTLERTHTSAITVAYALAPGTALAGLDYTGGSGSVVIPAGQTSTTIAVTALTRAGTQGDRTCSLSIASAVDGAAQTISLLPGSGATTVTVIDAAEAPPGTQALRVESLGSAAEGQPLSFRVRADLPATAPILFSYTTGGGTAVAGTDYTPLAGSDGSIATGETTATFAVTTALRSGYQPARTVGFSISAATMGGSPVTLAVASITGTITDTDTLTGNHGYWETLQADPAFQASMSESFRDQGRIDLLSQRNPNPDVMYNPAADTYERPKDAARVLVDPWQNLIAVEDHVVVPMDATQLTVHLAQISSGDVTKVRTTLNSRGRMFLLDDEIMVTTEAHAPLDRTTGILTLSQRGAYGTTPAPHAVGARPRAGGSSLATQVHKPFATEDGNTYLFTWDCCHTKRWLRCGIGGYKTFMLQGNRTIWLEPQNNFLENAGNGFDPDVHVGWAGRIRSYCTVGGNADFSLNPVTSAGRLGPGVVKNQPIEPYADGSTGEFFLQWPDRWTRHWIRIQQRANDYAILDVWIADEVQAARQVYSNVLVEVRGRKWVSGAWEGPREIQQFNIHFNTSTAFISPGVIAAWPALGLEGFRDLYSYVKNFAVLKWANGAAPDIASYLVQPPYES